MHTYVTNHKQCFPHNRGRETMEGYSSLRRTRDSLLIADKCIPLEKMRNKAFKEPMHFVFNNKERNNAYSDKQ